MSAFLWGLTVETWTGSEGPAKQCPLLPSAAHTASLQLVQMELHSTLNGICLPPASLHLGARGPTRSKRQAYL